MSISPSSAIRRCLTASISSASCAIAIVPGTMPTIPDGTIPVNNNESPMAFNSLLVVFIIINNLDNRLFMQKYLLFPNSTGNDLLKMINGHV